MRGKKCSFLQTCFCCSCISSILFFLDKQIYQCLNASAVQTNSLSSSFSPQTLLWVLRLPCLYWGYVSCSVSSLHLLEVRQLHCALGQCLSACGSDNCWWKNDCACAHGAGVWRCGRLSSCVAPAKAASGQKNEGEIHRSELQVHAAL